MMYCDDCAQTVQEGQKTICEVEPDSLDDWDAMKLIAYWNSEGQDVDCPCYIDVA